MREGTQGFYLSVGGNQKVPSSDESSSGSDSDRPVLCDSGNSVRSED